MIELDLEQLKSKRFAIAYSGGRDSAVLLDLFYQSKLNFFAINIEHGIRGKSSLDDTKFCVDYCNKKGIQIKTFSIDTLKYAEENKLTIEQAARVLRYKVFDSLIDNNECDFVALAHHADDQVETLLMRMFRGTGINGLVGMKEISGHYIRPLLSYSRDDINQYVKDNNIPYVEDETNKDTNYTRNFLREEIGRIKERYPEVVSSMLRLRRNVEEVSDFVNARVPAFETKGDERFISFDNFKEPLLAKLCILNAIRDLGVSQDIEEKHLELMLEIKKNNNGAMLNMPHSIVCVKEEKGIILYLDKGQNTSIEMEFSLDNLEELGYGYDVFENNKIYEEDSLYVDLDRLTSDCVIRTRNDGDYINKFGGGTKSLGDYLTDKKVPKRSRNNILVVAKGEEVLVILGMEISSAVKITNETKKILRIDKQRWSRLCTEKK